MAGQWRRYLRYAGLGLRILLPTPAEWRYVRAIRRGDLFDRAWYRAANPRLPWICRLLPERHYILVGEAAGLCPGPGFSPRAYRHLNPDLPAGVAPLWHYLSTGAAAERAVRDLPAGAAAPLLPVLDPADHPVPPAPVAVVLHLHYRELWEEIAARLRAQQFAFDLFVPLTPAPAGAGDADIRARIRADFPAARIHLLPNHGRDILPFLHLAQSGVLAPYQAVAKIHTKKSPHRDDGDHWRGALLDGILGAPAVTARRLAGFLADAQAGFWVADGHRLAGPEWWGPQNTPRATELLARSGITLPVGAAFAAGSIWWARAPLVQQLAALRITPGDFEPEMGQVDGTTAHALERGFGAVAAAAGLAIRESRDLDL